MWSKKLQWSFVSGVFYILTTSFVPVQAFQLAPLIEFSNELIQAIDGANQNLNELAVKYQEVLAMTRQEDLDKESREKALQARLKLEAEIRVLAIGVGNEFKQLSKKQDMAINRLAQDSTAFRKVFRSFQTSSLSYVAELASSYKPQENRENDRLVNRRATQVGLLIDAIESLFTAYIQTPIYELAPNFRLEEVVYPGLSDRIDENTVGLQNEWLVYSQNKAMKPLLNLRDALNDRFRTPVYTEMHMWDFDSPVPGRYFPQVFAAIREHIRQNEKIDRPGEMRADREASFEILVNFWDDIQATFYELARFDLEGEVADIDPIFELSDSLVEVIVELKTALIEVGNARSIVKVGEDLSGSVSSAGRISESLKRLKDDLLLWSQDVYVFSDDVIDQDLLTTNQTMRQLVENGCLVC